MEVDGINYVREFTRSKKIKLLVLTSSFPRFIGDFAGNFVYDLASHLQHNGVRPFVLAPLFRDEQYNITAFYEIMDQIDVTRFPYFYPIKFQRLYRDGGFVHNFHTSHLAKIQLPFYLFSQLIFAIILVKRKKIQIVHSHWLLPQGLIGAMLRILCKKPHILTIHAGDVFALRKISQNRRIVQFIVFNCDQIFIVSNYVYHSLLEMASVETKQLLEKKVRILPMGVSTSRYNISKNIDNIKNKNGFKYSILFIGRLHKKKGAEYLIKAMKLITDIRQDFELYICGNGPLRTELEILVNKLELNLFVHFKGFVTDEEKKILLYTCDILVVPSIIMDSGETEGLPVVILEGLSTGKSIIASDVSGASDVITDGYNGFLIEQKKPELIAEKIFFLMNNPNIKKIIEKNAFQSSIKYGWDNISNEYLETIHKLLRKG